MRYSRDATTRQDAYALTDRERFLFVGRLGDQIFRDRPRFYSRF